MLMNMFWDCLQPIWLMVIIEIIVGGYLFPRCANWAETVFIIMVTRRARWRRKVISGVYFSLEQWRFLFPESLGPFFPLRISLCLFHNLLLFTTVLTTLLSISLRTLSHKESGNRVNTLRYLGAILFSPFLLRSRVHNFLPILWNGKTAFSNYIGSGMGSQIYHSETGALCKDLYLIIRDLVTQLGNKKPPNIISMMAIIWAENGSQNIFISINSQTNWPERGILFER